VEICLIEDHMITQQLWNWFTYKCGHLTRSWDIWKHPQFPRSHHLWHSGPNLAGVTSFNYEADGDIYAKFFLLIDNLLLPTYWLFIINPNHPKTEYLLHYNPHLSARSCGWPKGVIYVVAADMLSPYH
jgi:hypothetical protein